MNHPICSSIFEMRGNKAAKAKAYVYLYITSLSNSESVADKAAASYEYVK